MTLMQLPERIPVKKWEKGTITSIEKGQPAPFSGTLFIEERAKEAGNVRVAYDELWSIADINRRFTETVLKIADKQLADADAEIEKMRKREQSWWNRNKVIVGISGGFVFGVSVTGLIVWGVSKAMK